MRRLTIFYVSVRCPAGQGTPGHSGHLPGGHHPGLHGPDGRRPGQDRDPGDGPAGQRDGLPVGTKVRQLNLMTLEGIAWVISSMVLEADVGVDNQN